MIVDFEFDTEEQVYYCIPNSWNGKLSIKQGKIFGFSCFDKQGKLDKRVNFREYNGVPIEYVKRTLEEVETVIEELNGRFYFD